MRKYLASITLISLIGVNLSALAQSSAASRIKAEVGGTIRNQLPRPKSRVLKPQNYPKKGSIKLTTEQYCGDGDVAHYAQTHPSWSQVTTGNVQMVLGYWVGGGNETSSLPTADNWIPLGKTSLDSNYANTERMTVISKANDQLSIMALTSRSVNSLIHSAGYRMPASPGEEKYHVYYGVMMCKEILAPNNFGSRQPTVNEVQKALVQDIPGDISDALVNQKDLDKIETFSIYSTNDTVRVRLGKSESHSLKTDFFFKLAEKVALIDQPSSNALDKYLEDMGNLAPSELNTLYQQFPVATRCISSQITGVVSPHANRKFWWEAYPMQLTCKSIGGSSGTEFKQAVTRLFAPTEVPKQNDFLDARDQVVAILYRTAVIQQVQEKMQTELVNLRPKDRCFDPSMDYVDKVMGSLLINVGGAQQSNTLTMVHPEPYFAIGGDAPYRDSNGNHYTIFNASSGVLPLTLERGGATPALDLNSKSFLLNFKVRGVGCAQNPYCLLEQRGPGAAWL